LYPTDGYIVSFADAVQCFQYSGYATYSSLRYALWLSSAPGMTLTPTIGPSEEEFEDKYRRALTIFEGPIATSDGASCSDCLCDLYSIVVHGHLLDGPFESVGSNLSDFWH
jgi:hypothetical protein